MKQFRVHTTRWHQNEIIHEAYRMLIVSDESVRISEAISMLLPPTARIQGVSDETPEQWPHGYILETWRTD